MPIPVWMIIVSSDDAILEIRGAFPSETTARTGMFDCAEDYGFDGERDDYSTELFVKGCAPTLFQLEEFFMAKN